MSDNCIDDILLCSFNVKNGNIIEHSINNHYTDNKNIAFKAIPDNSHLIDDLYNIIFLPENNKYGISYYKKIETNDAEQRNSVYKSLIIITDSLNLSLLLKQKLKITMDVIFNNLGDEQFIKDIINSLYQNLTLIYESKDQNSKNSFVDYTDNQMVEYNINGNFFEYCRNSDQQLSLALQIYKLLLLEKRIVFYTEDVTLLQSLIFLQISIMSLFPNALNKFSNDEDSKDDTTFNVLNIMSKYEFLKLPLSIFSSKQSWNPYLTVDEVETFINSNNSDQAFMVGIGSSLFLNHKTLDMEKQKQEKERKIKEKESLEKKKNGDDVETEDEIKLRKQKNRVVSDRVDLKSKSPKIEIVHYDVAFKLMYTDDKKKNKVKLEINYWNEELSQSSCKLTPQDLRFMNAIQRELSANVNFNNTESKPENIIEQDKFIRIQFENYLIDLLYFIKLYYYKEFVKLTKLDLDELRQEEKSKKNNNRESSIEKNNRKLQLKALEMIMTESEHENSILAQGTKMKKVYDSFGGKSFFKNWYSTRNYKHFIKSTDDRLFEIEMNEDLDFMLEHKYPKESKANEKWHQLFLSRFWKPNHPVYALEKLVSIRDVEYPEQLESNSWKVVDLYKQNARILENLGEKIPPVNVESIKFWNKSKNEKVDEEGSKKSLQSSINENIDYYATSLTKSGNDIKDGFLNSWGKLTGKKKS
ncbi:unnamed protein product [Hanseniaspora opuntiae]